MSDFELFRRFADEGDGDPLSGSSAKDTHRTRSHLNGFWLRNTGLHTCHREPSSRWQRGEPRDSRERSYGCSSGRGTSSRLSEEHFGDPRGEMGAFDRLTSAWEMSSTPLGKTILAIHACMP